MSNDNAAQPAPPVTAQETRRIIDRLAAHAVYSDIPLVGEDVDKLRARINWLERVPSPEELATLQDKVSSLQIECDIKQEYYTKLFEAHEKLERELAELRRDRDALMEATTIALRTIKRNSTPEQKAWSVNKIKELRGESIDAALAASKRTDEKKEDGA